MLLYSYTASHVYVCLYFLSAVSHNLVLLCALCCPPVVCIVPWPVKDGRRAVWRTITSRLLVQKPSRTMKPAAAWTLTLALSLALQVAHSTHRQSSTPSTDYRSARLRFKKWNHCFVNASDIQRGIIAGFCACTPRGPAQRHAHMHAHTHARTPRRLSTHIKTHTCKHTHTNTHT